MDLGPHLWTIAPRLRHSLRPVPCPEGCPWSLEITDPRLGPVLLSGVLRDVAQSEELLLVVHGLGGCADSHYARRAARAADAAGLSCLRINLRGSDRAGEDFYHAGLTADLHAALASPDLARFRRFYALGYSVGGHLALRLATEPADSRLAAVAAVCAPLDLALSAAAFDRPELWLYRRYVMNSLKQIYASVAARRPVPLPLAEAQRIRGLLEWDDRIVAPRHGFDGAADYYARQSVGPRLAGLRLPALLAAALGDPMVPAETMRPSLARAGGRLEVRWLSRGGHVGFPGGLDLEAQLFAWLRRQGRQPAAA